MGFRQMCSRAVPWLLAVASGSAPAVRPPPPTPAGSTTHPSPDVGPALAGSGAHWTVLLDRSNWGWYLERSDDAGATWTETRIFVAGSPIVTSRASYDVVTREGNWVHIGRDGTVAEPRGVRVEPTSSACASEVLWVPDGEQLAWSDRTSHGTVRVAARGELACSGNAVLAIVDAGLVRCTPAGCDAPVERGDFADLASDGIVTATQRGRDVVVRYADRPPATLRLADGERVVAMAVWRDVLS